MAPPSVISVHSVVTSQGGTNASGGTILITYVFLVPYFPQAMLTASFLTRQDGSQT